MRFRNIVENKKNTLEEAIEVCKRAGYVLTEARPRPWRGDMRTRLRDKSMPDDMAVDMAAKDRRGAAVAAWREAVENETIFADEMLVNKLNMLKAKLDSCHFSWRESKDGPYKITIRIKDVFDYAKPTEDTEKLWKKIKADLKQMLGSNGVLAHGVKVVPGGYVVCAWSLHNFEPYKNDEPFTREDVIDDIKTGIESIVMVCDKWNYEAEKESKREFSSMEESYINEAADDDYPYDYDDLMEFQRRTGSRDKEELKLYAQIFKELEDEYHILGIPAINVIVKNRSDIAEWYYGEEMSVGAIAETLCDYV